MSEKLTRQQIYDRIRTSSKDSYILEEMQRLGFWESSSAVPSLPETLIRQETAVHQELQQLLEQDRRFRNQEAMLQGMRKARMKQAKEKREQTRQKHKQKAIDKAERWKQTQLSQIIYLGEGVSGGLSNTGTNTQQLQKFGLPVFRTVAELATAMQLDLSALRYLLYQRKVARVSHYHVFAVPKKSGGKRYISAPKKRLKNAQRWVLDTILNSITPGDAVHGFVPGRSIVSNAQPHTGKDIVINTDLQDFFPSISYARVKGLFRAFGYSEQLATIFALICTHAPTEEVMMDGVRYYVSKGDRCLPQGSPASPAISNLIAYTLDKKIQGLANKFDFTYTRYADDISLSTTAANRKHITPVLFFLKKVIASEGFTLHPAKTHIMRSSNQQKVTGIVVNKQVNVERKELRRFRALLHNLDMHGWKEQQWGKARHLIHAIEGYIHYVAMVNPQKGSHFKEQLRKVIARHGYPGIHLPEPVKEPMPVAVLPATPPLPAPPAPSAPVDWWNIF